MTECPACHSRDVGPFCVGCGGLCNERDYSPHWIVNVCLDCGWDDDPEHADLLSDEVLA